MTNQSEALRLADALQCCDCIDFDGDFTAAAAELRRLYAENELLHKRCQQAYAVGRQSAQDDMDALLRQALEACEQFTTKELTVGQRYTNEGQKLLDTVTAIREHLEKTK